MQDRKITVRQFTALSQAQEYIRNNYDPTYPTRRTNVDIPDQPFPDDPSPRPTPENTGVPTGTTLETVSASSLNNLPADSEIEDKEIVGKYQPRNKHIVRRCRFIGTTTPGTIENGKITTVTAPAHVIDTHTHGVEAEFYDIEVCNGKIGMYLSNTTHAERVYIHNVAEDGVHIGYQTGNIEFHDLCVRNLGDLRYHSKLNYTHALTHIDAGQLRAQVPGVYLLFDGFSLDAFAPGSAYGPVGSQFGTPNRALMIQSGAGPVYDVRFRNGWMACGGNYIAQLEDKNFGPVQNWEFTNIVWFTDSYQSAGTNIQGGSGTATGNTSAETGESVDAAILSGNWA